MGNELYIAPTGKLTVVSTDSFRLHMLSNCNVFALSYIPGLAGKKQTSHRFVEHIIVLFLACAPRCCGDFAAAVHSASLLDQPNALSSPPPTHAVKVIQDVWTGSAPLDRGFRIKGNGDSVGFSVRSAGDFNDDGIDDVIIGWPFDTAGANFAAGTSYVVIIP